MTGTTVYGLPLMIREVHLSSLRRLTMSDDNVAFDNIPVFGAYHSSCHDSSLYIFVLVLLHEVVMLPRLA